MDCAHFRTSIMAFQEGSLPEEIMNSAHQHLSVCTDCTRLFSEFREIDQIIGQVKAEEPDPYVATRILQRIENEFNTNVTPAVPNWIRMLRPVSLAVALLCGILIGSYAARKGNALAIKPPDASQNIEFLRSNLFISEFTDEDKVLVLNK